MVWPPRFTWMVRGVAAIWCRGRGIPATVDDITDLAGEEPDPAGSLQEAAALFLQRIAEPTERARAAIVRLGITAAQISETFGMFAKLVEEKSLPSRHERRERNRLLLTQRLRASGRRKWRSR